MLTDGDGLVAAEAAPLGREPSAACAADAARLCRLTTLHAQGTLPASACRMMPYEPNGARARVRDMPADRAGYAQPLAGAPERGAPPPPPSAYDPYLSLIHI